MQRKRLALALAVTGMVVIVPAGVALSQAEPEQPTLGPEEASVVPELTGAAQAAAAQVLANDPLLTGVLARAQPATASSTQRVTPVGVAWTVRSAAGAGRASSGGVVLREIGVWSDPAGRAFGVELTVGLPSPMTITADWPTLAEPDSGWTAPTAHYTARNVTALTIDVDLDRLKVVNVEPDPDAEVEAPPGTALPPPADGGE